MTNKKGIIINGVDVLDCCYIQDGGECEVYQTECEAQVCYYQQLKRKEQECEELKKEKAEIKKYLGISDKTIIQRLEELQEFKDKLKISEYNYKQALDDIENIADDYNRVEKTSQYYRDGFDEIQDIINKAKEE